VLRIDLEGGEVEDVVAKVWNVLKLPPRERTRPLRIHIVEESQNRVPTVVLKLDNPVTLRGIRARPEVMSIAWSVRFIRNFLRFIVTGTRNERFLTHPRTPFASIIEIMTASSLP
jgi:hypothetical protein